MHSLHEFDLSNTHISGNNNLVADTLSRMFEEQTSGPPQSDDQSPETLFASPDREGLDECIYDYWHDR